MPITFGCVCGRTFTVADDRVGKRGKCPDCGTILVVPALVASMTAPLFVIEQDDTNSLRLCSTPSRRALMDGGSVFALGVLGILVALLIGVATGGGPTIKAAGYGRVVFWLAAAAGLVLPPILSASGALSLGRWLVMAAFCATTCFACSFVFVGNLFDIANGPDDLTLRAAWLAGVASFFGVPGSLLAAAVFPKATVRG
jgi:hypothetical protein